MPPLSDEGSGCNTDPSGSSGSPTKPNDLKKDKNSISVP